MGSVFENRLGAPAQFPKARITHEGFEIGVLSDGVHGDARGGCSFAEKAGGDQDGVMTCRAQMSGQPEEGQHVTGGTERQKGDFQRA